jgi:threonine synthase
VRARRECAFERRRSTRVGAAEHDREIDRNRQPGGRPASAADGARHRRHRRRRHDDQIIDAIRLLAETEGIFTEPAGGTTLAATIDLVQRGVIGQDESVVVCVTGNGYKTAEVVSGKLVEPVRLSRAFKEFESWWDSRQAIA